MSYWFTDEQWKYYISRQQEEEARLLGSLCRHMAEAVVNRSVSLTMMPSNYSAQNEEDNGVKNGWFLYDGEYGEVGDRIEFCPWCGRSLPNIPNVYIK